MGLAIAAAGTVASVVAAIIERGCKLRAFEGAVIYFPCYARFCLMYGALEQLPLKVERLWNSWWGEVRGDILDDKADLYLDA